jgi:hypothetical protein
MMAGRPCGYKRVGGFIREHFVDGVDRPAGRA